MAYVFSEGEEPSEELGRLAAAYGVAREFEDFRGERRVISARTIAAVLTALGLDITSHESVTAALADLEDEPWRAVLPPSTVLREGQGAHLPVHTDAGDVVRVRLELEDGDRRELAPLELWAPPREVDGTVRTRRTYEIPADLPIGWHEIVAETGSSDVRAPLAVAPRALPDPGAGLARGRGWGFMAQLYSVRSRDSWGIGDLADLRELTGIAGARGADFLLVNPLHAAEATQPLTASPYLPTTRRFPNPLYIRPEDIREYAYLSDAQRAAVTAAAERVRAANLDAGPIDRDRAWEAKRAALQVIYAAPRSEARQLELERFRAGEGQGLEDFALWCALDERFERGQWPAGAASVTAPLVGELRAQVADRVDFHAWLQWVLDDQLRSAQAAAEDAGMGIGIMHDLAVGVHPAGADVWSMPDLLARGVSVGAPPDWFNQQGQDWSQPPFRPDALARLGYTPIRDLVRTMLRHAGAVRIDHIIGLFRLWWVPAGMTADQGTYVRYDHEAMIGVLLLEAHRAGAVVIGEDLGTVEAWVREYLAERGVLGTSVLWFEKTRDDRPRPPEEFRRLALAAVTTHDLPTAAGYLAEEHVTLRDRLGLLRDPVEEVRRHARQERARFLEVLTARGLLPAEPTEREIIEALHRYLALTPSVLLGVALVDAVGDRRTQNQPGTDGEYPNWKLPLTDAGGQVVLIEDLAETPRFASLVSSVTGELT